MGKKFGDVLKAIAKERNKAMLEYISKHCCMNKKHMNINKESLEEYTKTLKDMMDEELRNIRYR